MIHHRVIPPSEILKEEDYHLGFGMDYSFYSRVEAARKKYNETHTDKLTLRSDFADDYDLREGHAIDGTPFKTRFHPILGKTIENVIRNERYVIEGIYKHFQFGFYWTILIHRDGTKSHGTLYWENINCKDPSILECIEESKKNWIFV